ncbi:putative uracil phosphoribosyltransferase [Synechococcus sp. NOUM97013]|nr:putative uracil phosphoribosyltransferase [Synechococcus sp. NOUM97013]
MEELGRWLTYEALRDWLPHRRDTVQTPLASTEGTVIEAGVPLLAVPILPGGLHLWEGARQVLPSTELCLGGLPEAIETQAGVVLLIDQISLGDELIGLLRSLERLGVEAPRLRVITALAASPGLKQIGETYPEITIHTACIDAELDEQQRILPGIGDPLQRLGIRTSQAP